VVKERSVEEEADKKAAEGTSLVRDRSEWTNDDDNEEDNEDIEADNAEVDDDINEDASRSKNSDGCSLTFSSDVEDGETDDAEDDEATIE